MSNTIENAVALIRGEGFTGAHSFILLTRYAWLAEDRELKALIGHTLEELSTMPESGALIYAYAEYYAASEAEFCRPAVSFLIPRVGKDDPMLPLALARCARAFACGEWQEQAEALLQEREKGAKRPSPFDALAHLELYRCTGSGSDLNIASEQAEKIRSIFNDSFDHRNVYDLAQPCENSAVAVLYDELARITQEERWTEARKAQNHFISLLADRYPTRVSFGLLALLADEFESRTVVCVLPGKEPTPELRALLSYYEPLTEVLVFPGRGGSAAQFFLRRGGALTPLQL